jgi:hypothetical protein
MGRGGVEPPLREEPDSKPGAATSYAICPFTPATVTRFGLCRQMRNRPDRQSLLEASPR